MATHEGRPGLAASPGPRRQETQMVRSQRFRPSAAAAAVASLVVGIVVLVGPSPVSTAAVPTTAPVNRFDLAASDT